jgi:UDP-GlcNAc:undecaprenyl-phosphate/decaprenyl-phosphate GlcNAc-1-phosphate transferase
VRIAARSGGSRPGRLVTALAAIGAARVGFGALTRRPPGEAALWERRNHRGEVLTLLEGPAAAVGTAVAVGCAAGVSGRRRAAGVLAAVAGAGFGTYDDLAGSSRRRGFKGHLGALAKGEVTSGGLKIVGIGAAGIVAGALVQKRPVDKLLAGVVVAGTANLINLFDLRPGRAAKAVLIAGLPSVLRGGEAGALAAAPVGAAAALLPEDLGERAMLGDAGANALGAALGVALAARSSRTGLALKAALLVGLTAASEKVSFTKVIAANPALNAVDMLGRRPVPTPAPKPPAPDVEDVPTPA